MRHGDFNSNKLDSYIVVNPAIARDFDLPIVEKINARFSIINLFDRVYMLRDVSGIGVAAPQYGLRRSYYLYLSKEF